MSAITSSSTTPLSAPSAGPSTSRPIRPPVVQPRRAAGGTQSIVVNGSQRGNPVLDAIKNVPWEYGQVVCDYQVGATTGVLFLSLRYHRLHPEYIHTRIAKLEGKYNLRVLLLMCDVSEHEESIRELTKVCLINNLTIMVAWTPEEAGLYLSTYKLFEHKPPDRIKERVDKDYASILRAALTSIRGVNKTDVTTLSTNMGSIAEMAEASVETLLACPGFGEVKSRRVAEAFQRPFRNNPFADKGMTPWSASQARREETPSVEAVESSGLDDMPPPGQSRTNGAGRREPSPEWDENLDMYDDEEDDEEENAQEKEDEKSESAWKPTTSTAPIGPGSNGSLLGRDGTDDITSDDEDEQPPAKRPKTNGTSTGASNGDAGSARRESPEWDIELDLN